MKFSHALIASSLVLASSMAFAAETDTADIQINVSETPFVTLVGTALTQTNSFAPAIMDGADIPLGDLGFDTNVSGSCVVDFASANNYELQHGVSSAVLVDYQIDYSGTTITDNAANTVTQNCLTATATPLTMASTTALPATVIAGTYSDTITVTVTTP